MSYQSILNKIGKQTVYLLNDFRDVVVKIMPRNENWHVKAKDCTEWDVHYSTDIANETLLEAKEITEKEYNEYS
jgi:hypothetical protein